MTIWTTRSLAIAATALLAIAAFFTVEGTLTLGLRSGVGRALSQGSVALGLMLMSTLIYQPSALFYLVPLAGALIAQRQRSLFVLMCRFLSAALLGCLLAFGVVPLAPAQNLPHPVQY